MDTFPASVIVVSHASALRAIRAARRRYAALPWTPVAAAEQRMALARSTAATDAIDFSALTRLGIDRDDAPVDLIVTKRAQMRSSRHVRCHLMSTALPPESLLALERGVYVAAPALALIQCAASTGEIAALALAYELCGSFTMPEWFTPAQTPPAGSISDGLPGCYEAEPALTAGALRRYMLRAKGLRGMGAARFAARYVLDGARSPSEAIMDGVYATPQSQGGFGIRGMELNRRVDFSPEAAAIAGMPYVVCDALVPDAASDLEYDGGYHDARQARIHDEGRTAGLAVMGIQVFPINDHQLRTIEGLEGIAAAILRRAGKRYRNRTLGHRVKQIKLLNGLRTAFGLNPC